MHGRHVHATRRGGTLDHISEIAERVEDVWIFPAKHFITDSDDRKRAHVEIEAELKGQLEKFKKEGKLLEAERIERRTRFDMAMMRRPVSGCVEASSTHVAQGL